MWKGEGAPPLEGLTGEEASDSVLKEVLEGGSPSLTLSMPWVSSDPAGSPSEGQPPSGEHTARMRQLLATASTFTASRAALNPSPTASTRSAGTSCSSWRWVGWGSSHSLEPVWARTGRRTGVRTRVGVLHVASPCSSPHHGPHPVPGLPSLIISEHGRTEVEILLRESSAHHRSTPILIVIFYHQPLSGQFHGSLALPDERISGNSLSLWSASAIAVGCSYICSVHSRS